MRRLITCMFVLGFSVSLAASQSRPLSNKDVIEMVALGLSDEVVIEKIRSVSATNFDTSIAGLKSLKAAKVSDAVLKAMIDPHGASMEARKPKDEAGIPLYLRRPPATGSTLENVGSLSGKLSLITASGDLKPARLADLFLLYADSKDSPALRYSAAVERKTNAYSDNCKAEAAKVEADTKAGRFSSSVSSCSVEEAIACEMVIIGKKTLRETLDAAKASQFQETQADEEGVFSFFKVPPGMYYLVAFGRAGFNEANWQKVVTVKSGEDVTLKLSSPMASCFMGSN